MKKVLSVLFCLVLVLSMTACGGGEKSPESSSTTTEGSSEASKPSEASEPSSAAVAEEKKVIDTDQVAITITGTETDSFDGYTVKMLLENKSSDKTYSFSAEMAALNGVSVMPFLDEDVTPGNSANASLTFYISSEEEAAIGEVTDVSIRLKVSEEDEYYDYLVDETVHYYPLGEAAATKYERAAQDGDQVLLDNDKLSVIVTGYDPEGDFGYTVSFYLVNKTDGDALVNANDVSVNGKMINPWFTNTVYAGTVKFAKMTFDNSELEENGIESVEKIEFELYGADATSMDEYVREPVTLTPAT